MTSPSSKPSSDLGVKPLNSAGILRRADQAILAGLVVLGGLAAAFWWVSCGGLRGGIARWEELEPREPDFSSTSMRPTGPVAPGCRRSGELARRIVGTARAGFVSPRGPDEGPWDRTEDSRSCGRFWTESWPAGTPADALTLPSPGVE